MRHSIHLASMVLLAVFCSGCDKFLAEKTDRKLVVPTTFADLQAMLDNNGIINNLDPSQGQAASDDYYLPASVWSSLGEVERNAYTWATQRATVASLWTSTYRKVYYANVILEALADMPVSGGFEQATHDDIRGQALFLRAKSHLAIAGIWAVAYDERTADTDPGIPIRLYPDFNAPSYRATVRQTYASILDDLDRALPLLPPSAVHKLRASKAAAHGLMARCNLFMGRYAECLEHAEASLTIQAGLLDYNALDTLSTAPVPRFNEETLHDAVLGSHAAIQLSRALVDTALLARYGEGDLRKQVFFRYNAATGGYHFKGSYAGSFGTFSGIAVDEVLLMAAECLARKGEVASATAHLDRLLAYRYRTDRFMPISETDKENLLAMILDERRKELLFRGLRFPDVKRLNLEGRGIGFMRVLGNDAQSFVLSPGDPRFALPIPEDVLLRAPGLVQNVY